ncbi:hypothetical protein KKB18_01770 [bacterium]|nr:hypothetical protein [Candidatus Micrarchaeota archaeon]MBU1626071.1 hypothetical protein [bacterium]MBU1934552.1 hypothetical protein [Patescibacteria group bacterium]
MPKEEYVVKSDYLRKKFKNKSFSKKKDRQYIDDLTFLEERITQGVHGFVSGWKFANLRNEYETEYQEMLKELDPKQYKIHMKEIEKQKKERKSEEQLQKNELKKKKEWWFKMGGKP